MTPRNKWLLGVVTSAMIGMATQLEGERPTPYDDMVGVYTVCMGHTGRDIVPGHTYTHTECVAMLQRDLAAHGAAALNCINVKINPNEYAAYTLFAYNVGSAAFCGSTLLRRLNAGDHLGACDGLLAWDVAGGRHVAGLHNRRVFERELCRRPVEGD